MPKSWSPKRERQYEKIKRSAKGRGRSAGVAKRLAPNPALWNTGAPVAALKADSPPPLSTAQTAPPATIGAPKVAVPPARQFGAGQELSEHGVNDGADVFVLRATSPLPSHSM